jgi:hypothetical protein
LRSKSPSRHVYAFKPEHLPFQFSSKRYLYFRVQPADQRETLEFSDWFLENFHFEQRSDFEGLSAPGLLILVFTPIKPPLTLTPDVERVFFRMTLTDAQTEH